MAFNIPDESEAAFPAQAGLFQTDLDILVAGHNGIGVVSGCDVTAQGSPNMTVAVAAGTARIGGNLVTVAGGNVTITAANATNPRFDLIVVDNSGAKSAVAGTAAASPIVPTHPGSTYAALATVYVPANDTAVNTNQITDKRVILEAWSFTTPVNAQTGTTYTLVAGDAGKAIEVSNAGAHVLTVPLNSSVAFPIGTVIEIFRHGVGSVTITPAGGVTFRHPYASLALRSQYSTCTIRKRATDEWVVAGDFI